MKTLLSVVTAALSLLLCSPVATAEATSAKPPGPTLGIEEAIRIAKEVVRKQSVNLADSYIDSTRFDRGHDGDRRKFWLVTWLRNEYANDLPIKGGQTYVHIYMDGTGAVSYGE
ncbi:MAG TPA: hypothetical protein VF614_06270 [Chthoniobacteraceae bacterium]|jgi:hypothetical protein